MSIKKCLEDIPSNMSEIYKPKPIENDLKSEFSIVGSPSDAVLLPCIETEYRNKLIVEKKQSPELKKIEELYEKIIIVKTLHELISLLHEKRFNFNEEIKGLSGFYLGIVMEHKRKRKSMSTRISCIPKKCLKERIKWENIQIIANQEREDERMGQWIKDGELYIYDLDIYNQKKGAILKEHILSVSIIDNLAASTVGINSLSSNFQSSNRERLF